MDPSFKRPIEYFRVPEEERSSRILGNKDFIVIDKKTFIVRGTLTIPVIDSDKNFVWGMWAKVNEQTGNDIWNMWEYDGSNLPSYQGLLDISPEGYQEIYNAKVSIQLMDKNNIPEFSLLDKGLLMYREQKNGITLNRIHDILNVAMPWLFENA